MLVIPGRIGHLCEGSTRREFLRVGSIGLFGLSLSNFFSWEKALASSTSAEASKYAGIKAFRSAKSVILLFLQGGPSHIDIWDPKPDAPSNIRGEFNPIKTKVPGIWLSETIDLPPGTSPLSKLDLGPFEVHSMV